MNDRTNAIALVNVSIPSLSMDETELLLVLQGSVYPGAKVESIKLVVGYCRAQNLDPITKPVHIVPMEIPTGKKDAEGWDIKEKRDVVMPGIGLYRIQASRTGEHAGTSEPEFGPDVVMKLGETDIMFPSWCRVTVKRLRNGRVAEYTATERWTENYAQKGRKKDPNAMWAKRPYAQLAKCAEAQALRKGFPEVGAQPTAEEMEGKSLDEGITIDGQTGTLVPQIQQPQGKSEVKPIAGEVVSKEPDATKPAPESMKKMIRARMDSATVTEAEMLEHFDCKEAPEKFWAELTLDRGNDALKWIANPS